MQTWTIWLATVTPTLVVVSLVVWRIHREVPSDYFLPSLAWLGIAATFGLFSWLLKGFSILSFFALIGTAYVAMYVGTLGHPGRLFEIWLGDETSTLSRDAVRYQIRFIAIAIGVVALAMPTLLMLIHR